MELYETEEQQIAALKKWWSENSNSVISGLIAGIIVIGGWNFWQNYKEDTSLKASALYEELLTAVNKNETESAQKIAERIAKQYDSTPYATYAKLFDAKVKTGAGDLDVAKQVLQSLLSETDGAMKHVARVRLLQLMLATGEYEQGLQLIAEVDQSNKNAFDGYYEELTGDFYVALGRNSEARTAYRNALLSGQISPLLQYKIDDLTAPELIEASIAADSETEPEAETVTETVTENVQGQE